MKRKRILTALQFAVGLLCLVFVYFFILKYFEIKHFSVSGFVDVISALFCGVLYAYLGHKYIKMVCPKRFDLKTRILIVVLCCLCGAGVTHILIAEFVGFALSSLAIVLLHIDDCNRDFGFAYSLLDGILSSALAISLYHMLLERRVRAKMNEMTESRKVEGNSLS